MQHIQQISLFHIEDKLQKVKYSPMYPFFNLRLENFGRKEDEDYRRKGNNLWSWLTELQFLGLKKMI